ncbi:MULTISPECIES: methyltransferase domain-containing protein [unclassified Paenibacillus]|uniref:methyltransferase domain-containing protein n=1 Tax=unclassified Paenibacillus TaxID=185978 RepID=UPI0008C01899|nr:MULTISPECIES: methyltransferase domain-containing protein [unclassified Paenibacillus]QLG38089.1 methyltransferase domain-containing protein [Paenibacillus sp. E222]SEO62372.1 DNA-binding transcriptional regulator, MerR family [Paenibacillus sp. OK076]
MNIKEAADRLGISARAIRFYEEKGLISPVKQTNNGYRTYTENDIWRLQTITALREIGMSLQDITQALGEIDQGNQQRLEEYLELQQAVMYAQWVELKRMLDTTQRMIDLNRQEGPLDVSHLHDLADSARRLREARQNWHDRWNYDTQAAIHDQRVQAANGRMTGQTASKGSIDSGPGAMQATVESDREGGPDHYGDEVRSQKKNSLTAHRSNSDATYPEDAGSGLKECGVGVDTAPFNIYNNYDEALEQTASWISPVPGEKGIDIGTGTGNLAGKLLERGAAMTAIDQSREMLRTCRTKYPEMHVKLGNFLALPFADHSFDFVVSSFAFHHLSPDQQLLALQEMQRVLTARGRICLTDLMFADAAHRQAYIQQAEAAGHEDQLQTIRERHFPLLDGLCGSLEGAGYVTKHIRHNALLHTVLAVPLR